MTDGQQVPGERWNFGALLVQGIARRVANELSSEKLVLPFLYTALGGAVLYTGLFAPVVIVARLLAQLLGARLVEMGRRTNGWLAGTTVLTASVLALLAGYAGGLPAAWLPAAFLLASALLGLGNGFGALVQQDMLGRLLTDRRRIILLFAIGAGSGVMVIAATVVSQLVTGFEPSESAADDHTHLIWASTGILVVASLAALATREAARAGSSEAKATRTPGYLGALFTNARAVFRRDWFRRFVVARVLFLSVEMTLPFFAVHAATYHAATAPSLSLFVIVFSLGMIGGGLVWPRVSRRSLQLVMSLSALVAGVAAVLAFLNHVLTGIQSPFLHAAMVFCLAFATQGTLDASTAYVVRASTDSERPYTIAVSSLAAGVVGIAIALLAGAIASEHGAIIAVFGMGALTVAAALYAQRLPDVWGEEQPRS